MTRAHLLDLLYRHYDLDLRLNDHRRLARVLAEMAVVEPGANLQNQRFRSGYYLPLNYCALDPSSTRCPPPDFAYTLIFLSPFLQHATEEAEGAGAMIVSETDHKDSGKVPS